MTVVVVNRTWVLLNILMAAINHGLGGSLIRVVLITPLLGLLIELPVLVTALLTGMSIDLPI